MFLKSFPLSLKQWKTCSIYNWQGSFVENDDSSDAVILAKKIHSVSMISLMGMRVYLVHVYLRIEM